MRPRYEFNPGTNLASICMVFFPPFHFLCSRQIDPDLIYCPSHKHFSLSHWGSSKPLQRNGAAENAFTQHCCWVLCVRKPWPEPSSSGMLPHSRPKGQGWLSQNNFFPMNSQTLLNPERVGGKGPKLETWKDNPPPPLKQRAELKS